MHERNPSDSNFQLIEMIDHVICLCLGIVLLLAMLAAPLSFWFETRQCVMIINSSLYIRTFFSKQSALN